MPYRCRAQNARNARKARGVRRLPIILAAVLALVAAVTMGAAGAGAHPSPAGPKPRHDLAARIRAVTAQLDQLSRRSDQLDEQYNLAAAAVTAAQRTAQQAQQAAASATASYQAAHAKFVQDVTAQYESGPLSSIGSLLTSPAPQQYLDDMALDSYLSSQFAATVNAQHALQVKAAEATRQAHAALTTARAKAAALARQKTVLQHQAVRFRQLLSGLTAQQRAQIAQARAVAAATARTQLAPQHASARRHSFAPPVTGPVSAAVQKVIAFAEAQVGKPYSYGASGPYAYDCSGLTMASWAQVGVHLPHSAAEQYNYGTHVAYSQLQPGDLIFLYSPIGHVELYVGHDLAVSAADPSIGIVYVHPSRDMADYTGATRLTP